MYLAHWSIARSGGGRETTASGIGWELFRNYLIAKEKFRPDFFLYENNKSAAPAIKSQIGQELGVDLMHINSALVSAQNRERFYAINWHVAQPEDRGVLLKDVLLDDADATGYRIKDLTESEMLYMLRTVGTERERVNHGITSTFSTTVASGTISPLALSQTVRRAFRTMFSSRESETPG